MHRKIGTEVSQHPLQCRFLKMTNGPAVIAVKKPQLNTSLLWTNYCLTLRLPYILTKGMPMKWLHWSLTVLTLLTLFVPSALRAEQNDEQNGDTPEHAEEEPLPAYKTLDTPPAIPAVPLIGGEESSVDKHVIAISNNPYVLTLCLEWTDENKSWMTVHSLQKGITPPFPGGLNWAKTAINGEVPLHITFLEKTFAFHMWNHLPDPQSFLGNLTGLMTNTPFEYWASPMSAKLSVTEKWQMGGSGVVTLDIHGSPPLLHFYFDPLHSDCSTMYNEVHVVGGHPTNEILLQIKPMGWSNDEDVKLAKPAAVVMLVEPNDQIVPWIQQQQAEELPSLPKENLPFPTPGARQ